MVVRATYSQRLLDAARLSSAKADVRAEAERLESKAVPLVHELQRYQRPDGSVEPSHSAAAGAGSVRAARRAVRERVVSPAVHGGI